MRNKKYFLLLSIVFFFLSDCTKKDNLQAEEERKELAEMSMTNLINESYLNRRNELIELIKKVPYPDEPEQIILWKLKQMESFLVIEEHSDELLDYALDFFQDETLTYSDKKVIAYVLLGVDAEKYKYFLRDLALCLLSDGNMDRYLVGFCFYPGADLGVKRVKNYQDDPVVKEALEAYETYEKLNPMPPFAPNRR